MRFWVALLVVGWLHGADPVSFTRDVQPIFAQRCEACHKIPFLVTAAQAKSLMPAISGDKPRMPKVGAPLTPAQVATLKLWVEQGAKEDETWWALRPLVKPAGSSIDAFIGDRLRAAGLTMSPAADRRTLARRVYYDLHGLPPTPEELNRFVNDPDPAAYDKLVDRLLASSRYGERWARHWLDVVHYGDSHGYDKDKPRLNAWPYRDYVIRSFNKDKPYARFVREQIAGDVLFPDDPEAFIATGFLAAGPWDFVGHQELREGTAEKENTRLLDRDDMVATTISTFVSMTAHCARCHNHKFDPIPQQDYFNLQAVFAGIDRADRPFHDEAAVNREIQRVTREKHALQLRLQPLLDKVEFATSPEIVDLDSSIQDAGLQIAHIGTPKTPADTELKAELEARRVRDRERKKQLVEAIIGPETYAAIDRMQAEMKALDEQMPKGRMVYSGAAYFPRVGAFRPSLQPRKVWGQKPAAPGALTAVPVRFATDHDARSALANWIGDSGNMLTWRSIVNRVWHYHFGAGLVDTPSDFGRMGSKPSHPELLDWLAVWFRDEAGGSLKQLHRMILLSDVYKQQSRDREDGAKLDADNRLLWRMNRTRLDAESVRDSVLSVAGKLDLTMGGPAVQWFRFKDDHSPVYDYASFDADAPGAYRRSIYRFVVRSVPDPFLERLDCPDPSVLTPKRSTTLTPIQALTMMNNPFVVRMSEHLAERVGDDVAAAVRLCYGREASAKEAEAFAAYAKRHGMANLARLLLNSNEFQFVD
jgi:hypothetical protein